MLTHRSSFFGARSSLVAPIHGGARRRARAVPVPVAAASGTAPGGDAGSGSPAAALAAQRTWLRRQRVLQTEPHPSDDDLIELNVGGAVMVTCRGTLRQVRGSSLAALFDPANERMLLRDRAGRVFLDQDPAAFALALRYLRELRVSGGCSSTVLLPPIPPRDVAAFRSLAAHLGLQVDCAAITAAAARGAALAGGGNATPPSAAAQRSGTPTAQSSSQPQAPAAQQPALVRPLPPDVPPSGKADTRSARPPPAIQQAAATHWMQLGEHAQRGRGGGGGNQHHQSSHHQQQQQQAAPVGQQPPPAPPTLAQHYYIKTSPALLRSAGVAGLPALPLRVTVFTEDDLAPPPPAASGGAGDAASGPALAAAAARGSPAGLVGGADVFISSSAGRGQMLLSVVARNSAGLDNLFVGVTSANHTDQRGMQIPSFGWRQLQGCAPDGAPGSAPGVDDEACHVDGDDAGGDGAGGASADARRLWRDGDLVQLELTLGTTNTLRLMVNGAELGPLLPPAGAQPPQPLQQQQQQQPSAAATTGRPAGSAAARRGVQDVPTFRSWCWYIAFFRGASQVVALVLEPGSYSVYSGDHVLKRYLG